MYFNSNYKCTFSLLESSIWKGINYIGIQNLPNSQIEIFYFLHFSIHGICLLELKHNRKESDWATLYNANQECFPEVQGAFLRQLLYHVKTGEIIPMILRVLVTYCYQKTFFCSTLLNVPYSWGVSALWTAACFIIVWVAPWGDALSVRSAQGPAVSSEELAFFCCCWRQACKFYLLCNRDECSHIFSF